MLKINIKNIPSKPGVYVFKNKNAYLYIGKAVNLRNRIKQYIKKETQSPFLDYLLKESETINFQNTNSEIESLILESQLIKKHKPKYNIKLRDDKKYFYVGFTKEKFPKLFLTHQPSVYKKQLPISEFIGPFTDGVALKTTLRLLRKIFPYCTCKQKHHNFCLNYHIGNCIGYCCLLENVILRRSSKNDISQNSQKYKQNIQSIKSILTGKKKTLINKFKKEMKQLAKEQNFETAIEIKNKIEKLEKVFENAKIINKIKQANKPLKKLKRIFKLPKLPQKIEAYDISNIQGENATGSMVVFENNELDKKQYRKFKIKAGSKPNDTAMLKELLRRRLNHPDWKFPDLIIVDGGKAQINSALKVLKYNNIDIPVIALAKRGKKILASTIKNSIPLNRIDEDIVNLIKLLDSEAHRFAIKFYRKIHRKRIVANQ